jgi:MFS transporter, SP family, sugar:H+ symporter
MIYETKGLTLEQVDELYGVVGKAWKSKHFRPTVHFAEVDADTGRKMSLADIAANQERKRSVQHEEGAHEVPAEKV